MKGRLGSTEHVNSIAVFSSLYGVKNNQLCLDLNHEVLE